MFGKNKLHKDLKIDHHALYDRQIQVSFLILQVGDDDYDDDEVGILLISIGISSFWIIKLLKPFVDHAQGSPGQMRL